METLSGSGPHKACWVQETPSHGLLWYSDFEDSSKKFASHLLFALLGCLLPMGLPLPHCPLKNLSWSNDSRRWRAQVRWAQDPPLLQGPSRQILGQRSPVLRCVPHQLPTTYLLRARPSQPDLQKLPGNNLLAQYLLSTVLRRPSNQRAL